MANLSIKNVKKVYSGGVEALSDFSLEIKHGEFIVFVGPSGCGKSTMLRMIAGLETITSGELRMGQKLLNDVAPADRNIAMVFQNYALFGTQTVYENVGFPLTIRHVSGDEIHSKVMEAAEIVEIVPELNRKPNQLSGGQRQRVAIGRSLVRNPEVFLMDEPLSNLDAKLRTQTRKELALLHKRLGATFVYVTHDQIEAMTIADRIVVINGGLIQQIGTPNEIYNNPKNMFVASFIGAPAMNLIHGTLRDGLFVNEEFSIGISKNYEQKLSSYGHKKVVLGIRPEHITLKGEYGFGIKCHVDVVECLGYEYVIYLSINDLTVICKESTDIGTIKAGDETEMFFDTKILTFFDHETESRIV